MLALVGGRDPKYAGFNRAVDASRPIGSSYKHLRLPTTPSGFFPVVPVLFNKQLVTRSPIHNQYYLHRGNSGYIE